MDPVATFEELRSFWQTAYASLDPQPHEHLQLVLEHWASGVLTADGAPTGSAPRSLFSLKPPEPFFGKWRADNGGLSVEGKTVVVLINPGDGIGFAHCADRTISIVGRPYWSVLKEFYTTGAIAFRGKTHALLYKRELKNPDYDYRHGTRNFAWGWWSSQWSNMLRAIGEGRSEEDAFLTIELFAYSSPNASQLSADAVSALKSSRLVVRLLAELVRCPATAALRRVVLVNKRPVWERALAQHGITLKALGLKDRAGNPRAFRGYAGGRVTSVPLLLLNGAQGMKFPSNADAARTIFEGP